MHRVDSSQANFDQAQLIFATERQSSIAMASLSWLTQFPLVAVVTFSSANALNLTRFCYDYATSDVA